MPERRTPADRPRRQQLYGIRYVTVGDMQMPDFAPVVARLAGS